MTGLQGLTVQKMICPLFLNFLYKISSWNLRCICIHMQSHHHFYYTKVTWF